MFGIFKRFSANDIKITPFEANKQYFTSNVASLGVITASINWSNNISLYDEGNLRYNQINKLFYKNYNNNFSNLLEIDEIPYKKQERKLYHSASLISFPQTTFGNNIKPTTFEYSGSIGLIKDDGFGNLYDSSKNLDNYPNENNRVFYLAPLNGHHYNSYNINHLTGDIIVNSPSKFSLTTYDDSYQQNNIRYYSCSFTEKNNTFFIKSAGSKVPYIEIANKPYLNFVDGDFTISFFINTENLDIEAEYPSIVKKQGYSYIPNSNTIELSNNFNLSNNPEEAKYPYKIYYRYTSDTGSIYFERSNGAYTTIISESLFSGSAPNEIRHIAFLRQDGYINTFIDGIYISSVEDITGDDCSNFSNIRLFPMNGIGQFMMWDIALSKPNISYISESFTGTYSIGNIFYDSGFGVITHPKYQNIFDDIEYIKYQGSTFITENEYQCTVGVDEFNFTNNVTIRKNQSIYGEYLKDFTTGSYFKPYVTTIGLYDDDANLLAVGKLGQPIRMSDETDTTFILRWDI